MSRRSLEAVQAEHDGSWALHGATLERVVEAARDRASLTQAVAAWRYASTPAARVEAGRVMIRVVGVEAARQGGAADVDAALGDIEQKLQTYSLAIEEQRAQESGLASDLARSIGLSPEGTVDTLKTSSLGRVGTPLAVH